MGCAAKFDEADGGPSASPKTEAKLSTRHNEAMGYTIALPEDTDTSGESDMGAMYSHDTTIIEVDPSGVALKTPDDLLRAVNTGEGKVEKKTEGDVVVVSSRTRRCP